MKTTSDQNDIEENVLSIVRDLLIESGGEGVLALLFAISRGLFYVSQLFLFKLDRLRESHLVALGWRIRRIWSTDWFKKPQLELKPIIRELHELKTVWAEEETVLYTPENHRLLRPAMIDAFLEYLPSNKWEFLERIPSYSSAGNSSFGREVS